LSRIMCSVNNCHYWDQGNVCNASTILVTSDQTGESEPDDYDAPQSALSQVTPVDSCMATCCKTFVERGSDQVREDGVTRNPY